MQPTYSPDGRYWWDGHRWQLVPGAPVQGPPPPDGPPTWNPPPAQPTGQPAGGWPPPPSAPPRRPNRVPLIIALGVLVLVIIAVPVVYFATRGAGSGPTAGPSPTETTTAPAAPTIQPGEPVTKEKLSQVSASEFLWANLTRQMTEPVTVITDAYFAKPANFTNHDLYYVKQVGIDHRSGTDVTDKEVTLSEVTYIKDKPDHLSRCIDGKEHWVSEDWETKKPEWHEGDTAACQPQEGKWARGASDGMVPNGLQPDQAEGMIASLRDEFAGFANPQQPTLITASGKTYVRQIVDYKPLKLAGGQYWGTQIFLLAFKRTGLDSLAWPFQPGLGPGEGLHVAYYLDPETLLPVASVLRTTPVLAEDGSVRERYDQTQVFNYRFPDKLTPLNLKDTKPIPLLVPEGWKIPK